MNEHERRMTDAGSDPEAVQPGASRMQGPGSRTAEIEREIEDTRARMTRDIDEIGERLRPANLARETVQTFRHEARRTGGHLANLMRENSFAVAAMGLGATWWFVQRERGGPVSGDRMARYAYTGPDRWSAEQGERRGLRTRIGDTVHVAERASSVKERAGEAKEHVQERVHALRRGARERASDLGMRAREQTRRARTGVEHTLEENPLLLVAGAAVLGLTVGLLLPSTQREDEVLGPSRDRLADRAGETFDRAREVATDAAREVKDSVRSEIKERAPELKSVVQDAAERVGDQVKQSASRVADETKQAAKGSQGGGVGGMP
jgi:ElaB/YqjD/DUF883 family membrane-anchored ribosome-binding protein